MKSRHVRLSGNVLLCLLCALLAMKIEPLAACEEGAMLAKADDCAAYLQCLDGELLYFECPSESYYNATYEVCVVDEHGLCTVQAAAAECTELELEDDPNDCTGYQQCINGSFVSMKCSEGSYFDTNSSACQIDVHGVCRSCLEGQFKQLDGNLCGYLLCVDCSYVERSCESGSYFNARSLRCVPDKLQRCGTCLEDALFEDPEDCASYMVCVDGELQNRICAYGSYFNASSQRCEADHSGICIPATEICEEGDLESDEYDCAAYFECIDGDFVAQQCDSSSYFNSSLAACITDEQHVCRT
ncbi:CG31077 [Drosophila busckii]|uniref:CG31077 n=1 Tax=Drosophila busckii TaxID=30019 RepID=A0A0M4EMB4_DROBS|nr:tenascin [Drosophila busckii]ALC45601.1 CG31077 [Drosophila busckii]